MMKTQLAYDVQPIASNRTAATKISCLVLLLSVTFLYGYAWSSEPRSSSFGFHIPGAADTEAISVNDRQLIAGDDNLARTEAINQSAPTAHSALTNQLPLVEVGPFAIAYDYANLDFIPAGVAGGLNVVFVGAPLDGRVLALSRFTGKVIGELPPPPNGFILPFIMHSLGPDRVGVLDAGGLPSPKPFIPASPTIYEYQYSFQPASGFSASLVRTVSFSSVPIGFAEDFVALEDGRYLLSDAILGSIWIAQTDGTITPGIVPSSFDPLVPIPGLAFGPNMPLIYVGGIPFLFTGSTLPGVSDLAVRDGKLYFYSSAGEGLFSVPIASLSDERQPFERAADISLISPKPKSVAVEELLGLTFNPFDTHDKFLYATDALQLRIIRIDVNTGERQVIADNPTLFNFPSSLAFLPPVIENAPHVLAFSPPVLEISPLVVVSNQQQRSPLTNDAIGVDMLEVPFIVTKIILK
jgi:hypothetical protein